jgi:hypothetical protein
MKITVDGHKAKLPFDGAGHVIVETLACPQCKLSPVKAHGKGITARTHDTYIAEAVTDCCGASVGQMQTKVSTIFGIEEDEAVLHGRPRVY